MTTPKRLSPEELVAIRHDYELGNKVIWERAPENTEALLSHIAALEAERSREMEARGALIARANALEQHISDLEKSLENVRKERDEAVADMAAVVEAWRTGDGGVAVVLERILGRDQPHPGAALLEEHRKALVRARNEGLRKAVEQLRGRSGVPVTAWHEIIAMLEPEEG